MIRAYEGYKGKEYLVLDNGDFIAEKLIKDEYPLYRIITSHFVSRFKQRTESNNTSEELIAEFIFDGDVILYKILKGEINKLTYINNFGFGLGEYLADKKVMILKTFVSIDMLGEEQIRYAKEIIEELEVKRKVMELITLMKGGWKKYLNMKKLIELILVEAKLIKMRGGPKNIEEEILIEAVDEILSRK